MRKRRVLRQGASYHVTAHINQGLIVFDKKIAKQIFLAVLKRAKEKYSFEIKTFCIMNNHIHLYLKPDDGVSLSQLMQWILSVFAMAWNRRNHGKGHVWDGRFFSRIVDGKKGYLELHQYIDQNPVKAHLTGAATRWVYCGLWHHRHQIRGIVEEPDRELLRAFPQHKPLTERYV